MSATIGQGAYHAHQSCEGVINHRGWNDLPESIKQAWEVEAERTASLAAAKESEVRARGLLDGVTILRDNCQTQDAVALVATALLNAEARGVGELRAAIERLRSQVGHDRAKYMEPSVILDEKQSSTLAAALERFGMQLDALLAGVKR